MSEEPNPYQSPQGAITPPAEALKNGVRTRQPCFQCGSQDAIRLKYTWWGGMLGPKLLHHVKCAACGRKFNSETGRSNGKAIGVYLSVSFLVFGLAAWWWVVEFLRHHR